MSSPEQHERGRDAREGEAPAEMGPWRRGAWARLWEELARAERGGGPAADARMVERWRRLARRLDSGGGDPDPLLDAVLAWLEPGMSVLDVGAGVGRWTVPLARRAARVTAVEPLAEMREVLEERLQRHRLANVSLVPSGWPDADVPPHDVVISAHSTYTSPDLLAFVRRMEEVARRRCYLILRVPNPSGAMAGLAERVSGCWHDSPNFVVGFNALLEAGIYANVLVEKEASRVWVDPGWEEARERARRHLRLPPGSDDEWLEGELRRHLEPTPEGLRWPDGMRSAMCWWEPGAVTSP